MEDKEVKWIKVLHSEDGFMINLASLTLKENGIENVVMDKKDSTHVMIGYFELYVPQDFVLKAKNHLKNLES